MTTDSADDSTTKSTSMMRKAPNLPQISLIALFVTALVIAQVLAVKLLLVPMPGVVPFVDSSVLVPAGVLAYAITFLASDCYAELYGRRQAQLLVNVAFGMNFVMLALVWVAIIAPGSQAGVDPASFRTVLGPSTNIVLASLAAYLVSQNLDVLTFHAIGDRTKGRYLWLRNLGSTGTSQLVDTTIFIFLGFSIVPAVIGVGTPLPFSDLLSLIVGQYLLKLLIALLDTPLVYIIVGLVRSRGLVDPQHVKMT